MLLTCVYFKDSSITRSTVLKKSQGLVLQHVQLISFKAYKEEYV